MVNTKLNLSVNELFGNSGDRRESESKPDPLSFSNFQGDEHEYLTKYPFESFDSIPKDSTGFNYPKYNELNFIVPTIYEERSIEIVNVDGLILIEQLGKGAFCIDPRRWHRIKQYIANGTVVYPESSNKFSVLDGRHRSLLLMQIYNRRKIPVVVEKCHLEFFMFEAKRLNAL